MRNRWRAPSGLSLVALPLCWSCVGLCRLSLIEEISQLIGGWKTLATFADRSTLTLLWGPRRALTDPLIDRADRAAGVQPERWMDVTCQAGGTWVGSCFPIFGHPLLGKILPVATRMSRDKKATHKTKQATKYYGGSERSHRLVPFPSIDLRRASGSANVRAQQTQCAQGARGLV
jgi:hypothetical protein